MSREKSGASPLIAIVLIIILIIALWWITRPPPPPPSEQIIATAFLRPSSGREIPKEPYFGLINPEEFTPDENTRNESIQRLEDLGFEILNVGEYTITFNSTKHHFEQTFNTEIETIEYSPIKEDFLQEIENAQNPPENGEVRTTFPYIEAIPNPIGVGQQALFHVGITEETGSTGIGWQDLTVTMEKPDGIIESMNLPPTNSTGGIGTTFVPDQVGSYILQTHFPEQTSPQGATMLASISDPLELVVQADPVPIDPNPPLTEFSSPYEDFIQEVENTADVNLDDFIYVSHQLAQDITIPQNLKEYVDSVELSPPTYYSLDLLDHEEIPPDLSYYYLNVPHELNDKLNVFGTPDWPIPSVLNGSGINVAIIDSGFYFHPFFDTFRPTVTVEGLMPSYDTLGHGTVVATNLLSVAPKVNLHMVKQKLVLDDDFIDPSCSFSNALSLDPPPDIIVCSWHCDFDWGLQHLIKMATANNIIVVCASGNYKQNGNIPAFPGDIPEVISVGGAYPLPPDEANLPVTTGPGPPEQNGNWIASSYALSGKSEYYDENCLIYDYDGNEIHVPYGVERQIPRICPDVCGIVGLNEQEYNWLNSLFELKPVSRLIMSPAGIIIDIASSIICGDQTKPTDGWAVLSGTSSAAPQVAGAVALMLQIDSSLTPSEVKNILCNTTTDVTQGISASGETATQSPFPQGPSIDVNSGDIVYSYQPDDATGYGVIHVNKAIQETITRLEEHD